MRSVDLISKKKYGGELSRDELHFLIQGFVNNTIPDYQTASFLMAVYFQGMTFRETALLTELMMRSGEVFDLSEISGIKVDKHSTGGVGDKVSLILAPLAASAGIPVPMVSGRGLGHTGGTLDKLESIPGFRTRISQREFIDQLQKTGVAIIGQTDRFVPADKKLYALRDVTATVDSIPLISASIVSKKVASGADAFVFDVKTGSGAFMDTLEKSCDLARSLNGVVRELGRKSTALVTDMNQPLGRAVGNSLEVLECLRILKGEEYVPDLTEICLELGARMLVLGGKASQLLQARKVLEDNLASGKALKKFEEMLVAQGGDPRIIEDSSLMDVSPDYRELKASGDGFISGFDAKGIGNACMILGAGRTTYDSSIDYGVGLTVHKKIGDKVQKGDTLFTVYYRNEQSLPEALKRLEQSCAISPSLVSAPPLIREEIQ
jgi:pyrimidine-nucleoside phosphorylase